MPTEWPTVESIETPFGPLIRAAADALPECEGCGGTSEPLNGDAMCGSCVALDARVDAHGSEFDGPR